MKTDLRILARKIANENKNYIYRWTDNRESAMEIILDELFKKTKKNPSNASAEELEDYLEAARYGYNSIEIYLEY
jgi:hypothetical protein